MKIHISTTKILSLSWFALLGASALTGCATKTTMGPVSSPSPATIVASHPVASSTPQSKPSPLPKPTPDPLAPEPIPQKPNMPGVSPLNHGADQPLYHSTQ